MFSANRAQSSSISRLSVELLTTVALTLAAVFMAALLTWSGAATPAASAHLVFAVGIVPLIFAAISHFVPVLTRTAEPEALIRRLPLIANMAGVVIVLALLALQSYALITVAALVNLLLAAILLVWVVRRASLCLGQPHPGWRWYAAALAMLMLALLSVVAMMLWPPLWSAWRLLHLHLNLFGLIGLAAFATLPVLLPTALGQSDPEAARWLKLQFWPMLLGVLLLALGAAFFWPVAWLGAMLLLLLALNLLVHWLRHFGPSLLWADGVGSVLIAAVIGWCLCLVAGALHATGVVAARPMLLAWVAAFLMPLVSGALSQLLPVWRFSGPRMPARDAMRTCLESNGRWRALLFLLAGLAFVFNQALLGGVLLTTAMLSFAYKLLLAIRIPASTR